MTTTEAALRDALEQQMEAQADDNTPSSIQRGKGLVWLEGWFDLSAALSQPSPASSTAGEGDDYKRGIYAAKCWLRDQQHKNPPDSLWNAAAILADRMDVALLGNSPSPQPDMGSGASYERERVAKALEPALWSDAEYAALAALAEPASPLPAVEQEAKYGWVFAGPDGHWHWSETFQTHELVEDQRPATALERGLLRHIGSTEFATPPAPASTVAEDERLLRHGRHLFKMAKSLGWPDDGEGAYEFVCRTHYEGGLRASTPATTTEPTESEQSS